MLGAFEKIEKCNINKVNYIVYRSRSMEIPKITSRLDTLHESRGETTYCFSSITSGIPAKYNRICYWPKIVLGKIDVKKWISILQSNGLLIGIESKNIENNAYVFDTSKIHPSVLYIYLSNLRFMAEEPNMCKAAMIYYKNGVGIHASIYLASIMYSHNKHHHYLPLDWYWHPKKGLKMVKGDLRIVRGFKKFMESPEKYTQEDCVLALEGVEAAISREGFFSRVMLNWEGFANPLIKRIIAAETSEKVQKLMEQYKKEKADGTK